MAISWSLPADGESYSISAGSTIQVTYSCETDASYNVFRLIATSGTIAISCNYTSSIAYSKGMLSGTFPVTGVSETTVGTVTVEVQGALSSSGPWNSISTRRVYITVTSSKIDQEWTLSPSSLSLNGLVKSRESSISGITYGAVTYKIEPAGVATVSLSGIKVTVTAIGVGEATVTVTAAGNSTYNPRSQTIAVTVTKSNATITWTTKPTSVVYGNTTAALSATSTSGGTVTFSSNNISVAYINANKTIRGASAGIATITATSPATSLFNERTDSYIFTVNKRAATVSVSAMTLTYTGRRDYAPSETTSGVLSGDTLYTGITYYFKMGSSAATTTKPVEVGTYTISFDLFGQNPNYNVTKYNNTLTIDKGTPTISFTDPVATYGRATVKIGTTTQLVATVTNMVNPDGSAITVTFASSTPSKGEIVGSTFRALEEASDVRVSANLEETSNWYGSYNSYYIVFTILPPDYYEAYEPYIYDGTHWVKCKSYIYDGTSWKEYIPMISIEQ